MLKSSSTAVMMASPAAMGEVRKTRGRCREASKGRSSLRSAGSLSLKQTVRPKHCPSVDFAASGNFSKQDADLKRAIQLSKQDVDLKRAIAERDADLKRVVKGHAHRNQDADLKRAIALSMEEAQLAAAIAVSKEDVDFDLVFDSFFSIFQQPAVTAYLDEHCGSFEDTECNKLEHTQIHNGYKQLVDALLTAELPDLAVTPAKFQCFCEQCLHGDRRLDRSFKAQLLSTDDFLVFKQMMIHRRSDLRQSIPLPATATHRQRSDTPAADAQKVKSIIGSGGMETPSTKSGKQLGPYCSCCCSCSCSCSTRLRRCHIEAKPDFTDGDVLETQAANFDVKPEPWLNKPLTPSAPSHALEGDVLETQAASFDLKAKPWLSKPLAPSAPTQGVNGDVLETQAANFDVKTMPRLNKPVMLSEPTQGVKGDVLETQVADFDAKPKPRLNKPLAPPAPTQGLKVDVLQTQAANFGVKPEAWLNKPLASFAPTQRVKGDLLETQAVNFDVKPEPWLNKPLTSAAPTQGSAGMVPEQRIAPTMEEREQRREHWCKQRDLLHRKGTASVTNITADASNPGANQNDGARLASQLRSSVDAKRLGSPPEDVVAKRQAITRQLRATFENLDP